MTREERRAAAKAKKEAAILKKKGGPSVGDMPSSSEDEDEEEDDMPANPNHSKASRKQASAAPVAVDDATEGVKELDVSGKGKKPAELSRREREAIQAQQAKERYQKLHEAGKTDEAKADLARLKLIREKREAEAARKQVSSRDPFKTLHTNNLSRPRRRSATKLIKPRKILSMLAKQRCEKLLLVLLPKARRVRSKVVARLGFV